MDMNLVDMVMQAQGGGLVEQLGKTVGLENRQAAAAVQQLLPALTRAMQGNVASSGGMESLLGALTRGHHSEYVENPQRLGQPDAVQDGNGILGHLLGSKDASRAVAKQVSGETGIGEDALKKLLPLAAAALMGTLSQSKQGGAAGILGLLTGGGGGGAAGQALGMLGKFLGR
jgi:hypothetical protein